MSKNVYFLSSDTHLIERVVGGEMAKMIPLENPHAANGTLSSSVVSRVSIPSQRCLKAGSAGQQMFSWSCVAFEQHMFYTLFPRKHTTKIKQRTSIIAMATVTIKYIMEKWGNRNSILTEIGIHSLLPPGGVKIKYLFELRQKGLGKGWDWVSNHETDPLQNTLISSVFLIMTKVRLLWTSC